VTTERDLDPASRTSLLPALSTLEVDELLGQVVERVEDLRGSNRRMRKLLEAVITVGSDLSLPVLLRQIVEFACDLVDARYGAPSFPFGAAPALACAAFERWCAENLAGDYFLVAGTSGSLVYCGLDADAARLKELYSALASGSLS